MNSNPATIMTDKTMADKIYIEPLTLDVVKRIIDMEKPDSVLANMGGQTGLNIGMELSEGDFLEKRGVKLLGVNPETIRKAEDRQIFKDTMLAINEPCIPSKVVGVGRGRAGFAPPSGIRWWSARRIPSAAPAAALSTMTRRCWRSARAVCGPQLFIRCSSKKAWPGGRKSSLRSSGMERATPSRSAPMENFDPVGVHTGDSIVVAPPRP